LIYLEDGKAGTPTIRLLAGTTKLPAGQLVRLRVPFSSFVGQVESTSDGKFDPTHLRGITILQGLDDGVPHTLYIDDITVEDDAADNAAAPVPPSGLTARGYDRHIELAWRATPAANIRYIKIYRALDGGSFAPIGVQ